MAETIGRGSPAFGRSAEPGRRGGTPARRRPVAPPRLNRRGATGRALLTERSGSRSGYPRSGGVAATSHQQGTATQAGAGEQHERNGVSTGVRQRRGATVRRLRGGGGRHRSTRGARRLLRGGRRGRRRVVHRGGRGLRGRRRGRRRVDHRGRGLRGRRRRRGGRRRVGQRDIDDLLVADGEGVGLLAIDGEDRLTPAEAGGGCSREERKEVSEDEEEEVVALMPSG